MLGVGGPLDAGSSEFILKEIEGKPGLSYRDLALLLEHIPIIHFTGGGPSL